MRFQVAILVAVLLIVIVFAGVNWQLFTTSQELNLVVRKVEAPLGLVMLGLLVLLTVLYVVFLAVVWTRSLVEVRRYSKLAQDAQRLASEAEASRFTELRQHLDQELAALRSAMQAEGLNTRQRLERAESELRQAIDDSHNRLVANLGEMEQRLPKAAPPEEGPL